MRQTSTSQVKHVSCSTEIHQLLANKWKEKEEPQKKQMLKKVMNPGPVSTDLNGKWQVVASKDNKLLVVDTQDNMACVLKDLLTRQLTRYKKERKAWDILTRAETGKIERCGCLP